MAHDPSPSIRPECLVPAQAGWVQPTSDEVRAVLKRAGLTGAQAAARLYLGQSGDRTVRRWTAGKPIPYAAWAVLCDIAGLGCIWRSE
jgi:hypothetical protein